MFEISCIISKQKQNYDVIKELNNDHIDHNSKMDGADSNKDNTDFLDDN